ncbi:NADH-ubiquinone oxidoreductase 12 kDa subunit [Irpex rosettiformis]|uniref:NADH-ubiquinone oxidoreductase 12 kDa subunit n=1 Tax=Irpex rosettiformis TaxID=378272 RepID=A0ACB8UAL1_9APHY|nr:NADH-ubiquinone oxidoreductase 12 kDa subunit [Irpex rosettiformis]
MATDAGRTADLTKRLQQREDFIRESWIRTMEARIVQDNLQKCYRYEGVNNLENCKQLAQRYAQMLKDNRLQGYKHIDI